MYWHTLFAILLFVTTAGLFLFSTLSWVITAEESDGEDFWESFIISVFLSVLTCAASAGFFTLVSS